MDDLPAEPNSDRNPLLGEEPPNENSLGNHFLVSMPTLGGDYFQESVTFLVEHNPEGAFGLVVNQPLDIEFWHLFPDLEYMDQPVELLGGGPVEPDRLFFLHSADRFYENSTLINAAVVLSTSAQLIEDLGQGQRPAELLAILGYAGWGPGQLETEILADAWLVAPFNRQILFSTNHQDKPASTARSMGIDLNLMGTTSGHG